MAEQEKAMDDQSDLEGPYFLRKRRRLSEHVPPEKPLNIPRTSYKRKNPIMHMPTEILFRIFSFITKAELANTTRLVNRRFRTIAESTLNLNFKRIIKRLENIKVVVIGSIHHNQDDMELRCLCKLLGIVELLMFYHSVTRSTIGRYIYLEKPVAHYCMFGGIILDLYDTVLRQFLTEPQLLYSAGIRHDYALSKEVKEICSKSKDFALFFDRVLEMPINSSAFCTGCKVLDILDSATHATRTIQSQNLIGHTLVLKLNYHFNYSWFVTLDIPEERAKMWEEAQRVMYMRLRRIVISHSEMMMQSSQYNREVMVRTTPFSRIRKPINCIYTGYGEVADKFFYYGVMNAGAYLSKFDVSRDEIDELEMVRDPVEPNNLPYLGLDIYVELRCPLELAPLSILESYKNNNEDFILPSRERIEGVFDLKVDFTCLGAKHPRLPDKYCYHIRSQK